MEIKRITADQVVEAYQRTGWHPVQDYFYDEIDGLPCGCGLAVMVGDAEKADNLNRSLTPIASFADVLGLDHDYASGFTRGFDGDALWQLGEADAKALGYQDGRDAWEAVKREVLDDAD